MPLSKEGEDLLAALIASPEGDAIVAIYNEQPRYPRRQFTDFEAYAVVERIMAEQGVSARVASELAVAVLGAAYSGYISADAIRKKHRKIREALSGAGKG